MRSPADSPGGGPGAPTRPGTDRERAAAASIRRRHRLRIGLERTAHLAALALIALLIGHALYAQRARPSLRAEGLEVGEALARWSTSVNPRRIHAAIDSVPAPSVRDWLAALPGAGTEAGWDGETPARSALSVEPVADPRKPSRVWVATSPGARVQLSDELGAVDSASVDGHGAVFVLPRLEGPIQATLDGQELTTNALRDSVSIKSALVVGMAGWEGKFIAAALEEHGWEVDARFAVAPSGDVEQGPAQIRLDTARYSFVVAMDSVIRRYADRLPRYVSQGGGLIVLGEASSVPGMEALLPARWGIPTRPVDFRPETADDPRRSFALGDLYNLKRGAIALEMRDDDVAVAGWRVGDGRVIQVGYLDTWRWRMAGLDEDAVEDHRLWWAALASGVAHAPRFDRAVAGEVEPTPRATLIETIGTPAPAELELASILDDPRLLPLLFGAAVGLLFLGWMSRRLRGAG
ncbi:MAG: hypothetical protein F4Z32_05260 [Gemmatimonadetes bacterium]|nr:hypothetical protein [Gemmatimonadota bacterium]